MTWRILFLFALVLGGCNQSKSLGQDNNRVLILGLDGMDYGIVKKMISQGKLPHLAKLAQIGGFQPLQTSVPPQSPTAWSNFITGMRPGYHGIFDFIHRDPKTLELYLSTLTPGRRLELEVPLIPDFRGTLQPAPASAYPYYEPERTTLEPGPRLTVR